MEKTPKVNTIISLSDNHWNDILVERISNGEDFTYIPTVTPTKIKPNGICLITIQSAIHNGFITVYLCTLKKQNRVATGVVRVKGTNIVTIANIHTDDFFAAFSRKFARYALTALEEPFTVVSQKLGEEYYKIIGKLFPDSKKDLLRLLRKINSIPLSRATGRSADAAVEKDALGVALDIFGAPRSEILRGWSMDDGKLGESFLSGLTEYHAYEDDIISNDLHNVPGYSLLRESITGVVEFQDGFGDKLLVINANRKPLEKATGVDLIYFHRRYEAFTCVQYKMMDLLDANSNHYYNPKQKSHVDELKRMASLLDLLNMEGKGEILNEYRMSTCPIFFKLCKKIQLKEEDGGLATGAYISLDQWMLLLEDDSIRGRHGGFQIGFHTLNGRYMRKDTFIQLVRLGLIGTVAGGTKKLAIFVESAIKDGHSVMYAIDNSKPREDFKKDVIDELNLDA